MSTSSPSIGQVGLGDVEHELGTTRRVLERLPEEHYEWKPHDKSWSLAGLATHVTRLLNWGVAILGGDEFDLAASPPPDAAAATRQELLEQFDASAGALRRALDEADDAALMREWVLRHGEHVIMKQPKVTALRTAVLSHMVHHRAQLTVYLRLLNEPVPAVYGPSADEG